MSEACSTYGREVKCIQIFRWKSLKGKDHLENLALI
jgi:hypothetical protein